MPLHPVEYDRPDAPLRYEALHALWKLTIDFRDRGVPLEFIAEWLDEFAELIDKIGEGETSEESPSNSYDYVVARIGGDEFAMDLDLYNKIRVMLGKPEMYFEHFKLVPKTP